ncbi:hypothetical protein ACU61A_42600 [Pseudonocardia sichuanensis]
MTAWEQHHPPHDHPDFGAYLDTLTQDDHATINAATTKANQAHNGEPNNRNDFEF